MGLDTVELVVSIEKHFGIEISDPVCESLGTVGEVAAWLGTQLGTENQRQSRIRGKVALQLKQLFSPVLVSEETQLTLVMKDSEAQRAYSQNFAQFYRLKLPALNLPKPKPHGGWLDCLFDTKLFSSGINPSNRTLTNFIDWTVALNYQKLLLPPFRSQYDVEQAVIGITSNSSGVEIDDVLLSSSFTDDLGMQ